MCSSHSGLVRPAQKTASLAFPRAPNGSPGAARPARRHALRPRPSDEPTPPEPDGVGPEPARKRPSRLAAALILPQRAAAAGAILFLFVNLVRGRSGANRRLS